MPEKKTIERARRDKRQGKSPSTQAGEFVKEEIEHVREGKHGARSPKQAIAIGLSKARRAGVDLPPPEPGKTSSQTRRKAERDRQKGASKKEIGEPEGKSSKRAKASRSALEREGKQAASKKAVSKQARKAAGKRSAADRSEAATKAARTKGAEKRSEAARKAARTKSAKQRSEAAKKAAETRKRNRERASAGSEARAGT